MVVTGEGGPADKRKHGPEQDEVCCGAGLVTDARAIFLDEPTTGLDSDSAEQLISLLSHLATQKHRTVRVQ